MEITDELLDLVIEVEKEAARRYELRHQELSEQDLVIVHCLQELQRLRWQMQMNPERLTARSRAGAYFKKCFEEECDGNCRECKFTEEICERLAAYEDTGLLPAQIHEIDKLYKGLCKEKEHG